MYMPLPWRGVGGGGRPNGGPRSRTATASNNSSDTAAVAAAAGVGPRDPLRGLAGAPRIEFIHIGKCGGTFVNEWLRKGLRRGEAGNDRYYHRVHVNRPDVEELAGRRDVVVAIVWVRDPKQRFRSAFDYHRALATANTSEFLDLATGKAKPLCEPGPRCLAPVYLWNRAKMLEDRLGKISDAADLDPAEKRRQAAAFHRAQDPLAVEFAQFSDANDFAEALSSAGPRGKAAHKLFALPGGHFMMASGVK